MTWPRDISEPAVGARGFPSADPTSNVLRDIRTRDRRQDDLRRIERRHIAQMLALTSANLKETQKAERRHAKELRKAESRRLDAIQRSSDERVQRAAQVQETAAQALAKTVLDSAEVLRTTVEAARIQTQAALSSETEPIKRDVTEIRRFQYETAGEKDTHARGLTSLQAWAAVAAVIVALVIGVMTVVVVTSARNSGEPQRTVTVREAPITTTSTPSTTTPPGP